MLPIFANAGAAQRDAARYMRLESGVAEIHVVSNKGAALGLRLGIGRAVRLEVGAAYATADSGYLTLDGGTEVRPFARGSVTPVLGVGAGYIVEPSFRGAFLRARFALEVELSRRTALRGGLQVGDHVREPGPHMLFIGLETRWGAP